MTVRDDILSDDLTTEQAFVVEKIMGGFTDGLHSSNFVTKGERVRQPKPAVDIDGFTDLTMRIIQEQQISEEIVTDRRVQFLQDFNPEDIRTEVITFGLRRREPWSMSQGKPFNQRHQEYKPHIRGIESDLAYPGHKVVVLGQKFENEIVLTCWAKTNKQANIRARWLEDTMRDWTWYIRYNGVEDFYFVGQEEDITIQLNGTENLLMGRPLVYYVRTERLSHVLEPTIRRIVVKYGLGNPNNTE
jgi:hypothetical protein